MGSRKGGMISFAFLRCQNGTSKTGRGGSRYLPYAFTEQGVAMLSRVLRGERGPFKIQSSFQCHSATDGCPGKAAQENRPPVEGEAIPISCNESKSLGFSFRTPDPTLMPRDLFLLCVLCAFHDFFDRGGNQELITNCDKFRYQISPQFVC
jgi:hypothetical protein